MITNIKKIIIGLFLPVLVISAALSPTASAAACDQGSITFFPRWYDGLCGKDKEGNAYILSPSEMQSSGSDAASKTAGNLGGWIAIIALNIVAMLLFAVGYVSLGFIIFGGFKYMTSGDNSSGTAAARKTILNAIIGLVLSIMAVAIVNFVAGAIAGGAAPNAAPPAGASAGNNLGGNP